MLGLERLAADQDSALAARLAQRNQESQLTGKKAVKDLGGDTADAQTFFARRRADFADELNRRANRALDEADADLIRQGAQGLCWGNKYNSDGTRFTWFDIRSFPADPPLVVAHS